MNPRDRRSARVVACLLLGRLAAAFGLTACLAHSLFHHPTWLWRAAAVTAIGVGLLAEAASLVAEHRLFVDELVRAVGLAALFLAAAVLRVYFARVPHAVDAREEASGLACAAGFAGSGLWLRRRVRGNHTEEDSHA